MLFVLFQILLFGFISIPMLFYWIYLLNPFSLGRILIDGGNTLRTTLYDVIHTFNGNVGASFRFNSSRSLTVTQPQADDNNV